MFFDGIQTLLQISDFCLQCGITLA
jgi:hypothetical protein